MHICEDTSLLHVVMKFCPSLIEGRKSKRERETAWCLHTDLLFWLGFLESRNTMFGSTNLATTASDEYPCADPESVVRGGPTLQL